MVIGISLSLAQSDLFKQLSLQYANLLFDKIVSFLRFNNTLRCLTKRLVSIWWVCRWGFDAFWETSPSGWILCLSTVNENWPKTSNYSRSHYFGMFLSFCLSVSFSIPKSVINEERITIVLKICLFQIFLVENIRPNVDVDFDGIWKNNKTLQKVFFKNKNKQNK